jgi:cysteine desulfurase
MRVYLDHQSATPLLPEVFEAMRPWLVEEFGNPSSLHSAGLRAREAVGAARGKMALFLGAKSAEEIIFTGNGTEAVNLAIKGAAFANERRGKHIVLSAAEHPAVDGSVAWLENLGFTATRVPVDGEGRIDPATVKEAIRADTILVCAHHANHDVGTIQQLRKLGEICFERGVTFFVDAVASAGWAEILVQQWNASLLALSPSRFYGPKGVGVLYRNRRARLNPIIHGGAQEDGRRAGTENVPAIVGAGVAAEIAARELSQTISHTAALQRKLWGEIQQRIGNVRLNGPVLGNERITTNLNLSFASIEGEGLALALDLKGVQVAAGAACVTKQMRIPPILQAIGLSEDWAKGTIIASIGRENTEAEIDFAVEKIAQVVSHLREVCP